MENILQTTAHQGTSFPNRKVYISVCFQPAGNIISMFIFGWGLPSKSEEMVFHIWCQGTLFTGCFTQDWDYNYALISLLLFFFFIWLCFAKSLDSDLGSEFWRDPLICILLTQRLVRWLDCSAIQETYQMLAQEILIWILKSSLKTISVYSFVLFYRFHI